MGSPSLRELVNRISGLKNDSIWRGLLLNRRQCRINLDTVHVDVKLNAQKNTANLANCKIRVVTKAWCLSKLHSQATVNWHLVVVQQIDCPPGSSSRPRVHNDNVQSTHRSFRACMYTFCANHPTFMNHQTTGFVLDKPVGASLPARASNGGACLACPSDRSSYGGTAVLCDIW